MYIIDGHNLIPKLPGRSLRELDDEMALVGLLQTFGRLRRKLGRARIETTRGEGYRLADQAT